MLAKGGCCSELHICAARGAQHAPRADGEAIVDAVPVFTSRNVDTQPTALVLVGDKATKRHEVETTGIKHVGASHNEPRIAVTQAEFHDLEPSGRKSDAKVTQRPTRFRRQGFVSSSFDAHARQRIT